MQKVERYPKTYKHIPYSIGYGKTEKTYVKKYGPYRVQKNFSVVTVPEEVRRLLEISAGDMVVWVIDDTGRCMLKKATIKIEEK